MLDSTQSAALCVARATRSLMGGAGLIRALRDHPPSPLDPPVFKVVPHPANTRLYTGLDVRIDSCGMAMNRKEAEAAAVGEFLERYCGSTYELGRLRQAGEPELGAEAVSFESLGIYAPEQYGDPAFPFERPRR